MSKFSVSLHTPAHADWKHFDIDYYEHDGDILRLYRKEPDSHLIARPPTMRLFAIYKIDGLEVEPGTA